MLALNGVSLSYKDNLVLSNISLSISKGDRISLLASSGGGKSTLAAILSLYKRPDSGTVALDGYNNIWGLKKRERDILRPHVQLVMQNPYLSFDPRLTIKESIDFVAVDNSWVAIARSLFSDIAILNKRRAELSGGELGRAALLRALSLRPDYLILDELTAALDLLTSIKLIELLKSSFSALGIIFLSHDIESAFRFSDSVYLLNKGGLSLITSPSFSY